MVDIAVFIYRAFFSSPHTWSYSVTIPESGRYVTSIGILKRDTTLIADPCVPVLCYLFLFFALSSHFIVLLEGVWV